MIGHQNRALGPNLRNGQTETLFLCEVLGSKRYWSARTAAQALTALAGQEPKQVRWLAMRDDAPSALIAAFNSGPAYELVGYHLNLDAALRALTGLNPLADELKLSKQASEEEARAEGKRARALWQKAYAKHRQAWLDEEQKRARERRELERKLDDARRSPCLHDDSALERLRRTSAARRGTSGTCCE